MSSDVYFTVQPCDDAEGGHCVYEDMMYYVSSKKFQRLVEQATHEYTLVESEEERARYYLTGRLINWEEKHGVRR